MPLHEYKCPICGEIIEALKSEIRRAGNIEYVYCKHCNYAMPVKHRIISKPAPPVFKGSGFYETDYKEKKK